MWRWLIVQTLARVEAKIDKLIKIGRKIMALADDLKASIAELDAETTAIATVIDGLVVKLQNPSLTQNEKDEVFAKFAALSSKLNGLGKDPLNPVP